MNSSKKLEAAQTDKKRTYSKPQLQIYGDFRQITQSAGKTLNSPDSHNPNHMTTI